MSKWFLFTGFLFLDYVLYVCVYVYVETNSVYLWEGNVQDDPAEWEPAFLRQAREFLFSTEELGPSPRGSDPVSCRLT